LIDVLVDRIQREIFENLLGISFVKLTFQ